MFTLLKAFMLLTLTLCYANAKEANYIKSKEAQLIQKGLQPNIRVAGQATILSTLKERMAHHKVPGVSIAFLKDHKISWTHTEGVIDLKNNKSIDDNTVFQAASISKPVFASVLMKYRQSYDLNLDINVNSLLKSWQLPQHQWTDKNNVTLRRLLSHSAGTTVHGFAGYASGEKVPTVISLLNGSRPANSDPIIVDIEPGTKFRYSGGGTTLAQLVLEDQSKISLQELAKKTIFTPLKMNHSSYSQPLEDKLKENAAVPYRSDGSPVQGGAHTYATLSAAGLWTTPSDLLRLVAQIQQANKGNQESIFTQKTVEEMLTPQLNSMGIGFFLEGQRNVTAFSHGGANAGFRAHVFAHTQTGDGVAIMTNSDNGGELIDEIMNRISEIYQWSEITPLNKKIVTMPVKLHHSIIGHYKVSTPFEATLVITEKEGQFMVNMGSYVVNEQFFPESIKQLFSISGMSLFLHTNREGEVDNISFWGGINASRINQ